MSAREEMERIAKSRPDLVAFEIGRPGLLAADYARRHIVVTSDADGRRLMRQARGFGWTSEVQR